MEILHPIRLLARPDGELNTLIHSVFTGTFDTNTLSLEFNSKHPLFRKNIETVEDGLRGLLSDQLSNKVNQDEFTFSFVMTNHDGRLYVFNAVSNYKTISIVTSLPISYLCRNLFAMIGEEPTELILPTIYALCELPILPMTKIKYNFLLSNNQCNLNFDELEQPEDFEKSSIILQCLTPYMMARSWEALMVERRVLVTSSHPQLLLPICEFLRKLISPLPFMGVYIPELPGSQVEAIDAPGTFVIGVDTILLKRAAMDLNGIVVLDIDRKRIVYTPTIEEDPYYAAPPVIISNILNQIDNVVYHPIVNRLCRPIQTAEEQSQCLLGDHDLNKILTDIQRIFVRINVCMLSAQFCRTKAFYRLPIQKNEVSNFHNVLGVIPRTESAAGSIGYSEQYGYKVGCVQLWKALDMDQDTIHHTIPCWMEMNAYALSVYEQADDLPLIFIPIAEFDAVESVALEPDGHVFQLSLKNTSIFRFTAADTESRQMWLLAIEEKINSNASERKMFSLSSADKLQAQDYPYPLDTNEMRFNSSTLGITPMPDFVHSTTAQHYHDFRHLVQSTQMVLSLYFSTECTQFETVFDDRNDSLMNYVGGYHSYEIKLSRFTGTLIRAVDIVDKINASIHAIPDDDNDTTNHSSNITTTESGKSSPQPSSSIDQRSGSVIMPTMSGSFSSSSNSISKSSDGSAKSTTDTTNVRPSFLQRFFSSSKRNNSKLLSVDDPNARRLDEAEIEERNTSALLERVRDVKGIYNRCLAELAAFIGEVK
jgi:hypothetical protein